MTSQSTKYTCTISLQLGLQEFQKELQNTEGEADSGLSSTQKLKEKHPAAGEGEDVRGVE